MQNNNSTWKSTLKVLGASWLVFSFVAAYFFAQNLSEKFAVPVVERQVLDYGPYSEKDGEKTLEETHREIALFRIEGIIAGTGEENAAWVRQMCREIEKAAEKPNVKAILLEINSPGGEVAAADSIYNAAKQAAETKPVIAYFSSLAASGGYYIGCAADTIIVHPESLTGSIGVIIQATNYAETFEKVGLKTHTFKSGPMKDMLNGARPIQANEENYTQSLVSDTYESFLNIVAESRELDPATLRKEAADGRVIKGTKAVEYKLADKTGYLRDAIEEARKKADAGECNIVLYKINTRTSKGLLSLLGKAPESVSVNVLPTPSFQTTAGVPWAIPSGVPLMLHMP